MNNLYIIFLIVGILFFSALPSMLSIGNEETTFLNYFRYLAVLLSSIIVTKGLIRKEQFFHSAKLWPLYIFLVLYILRLIWDLFLFPISFFNHNLDSEIIYSSSFYMAQFLGIMLIPTIGVLFINVEKLHPDLILKYTYSIIYFILSFSLLNQFQNLDPNKVLIRSVSQLTLSELTYGHYGSMLSILSIYRILKIKNSSTILSLIGFAVGIITVMVSGSRSPFLALLIVITYMMYNQFNLQKFILSLSFVLLLAYNYLIDLLLLINNFFPNAFADRIITALQYFSEGSSRGDLLFAGLNEFYKSPIFGNGFLIQTSPFQASYPHNLIVEAFMATGLLGGLIFLYLNFRVLQLVHLMKDTEKFWLGLLFIQFFIFSMFSGNLYTSFFYWIFLTLVLVVNYNIKLIRG